MVHLELVRSLRNMPSCCDLSVSLGKTSTIVATAKMMYNDQTYSSNVLELNASDDRGIDAVRDQIKEFAGTRRLFSDGIKLIILDEADAMTSDAQAALRRGKIFSFLFIFFLFLD